MEPGQQPPNGHDTSIVGRASRWVFGQPALIVLLFVMAFQTGWLGWYLVTVGIPGHLDRVMGGYRVINTENLAARAKSEELQRREIERWEKLLRDLEKIGAADPPPAAAEGKRK